MKLTLAEPKYLKESIGIISELVNEARFKFSKEGIELIAMDPANVAMVVFKLLSSTFAEYLHTDNIYMALNLSNLKQVLKRAKPEDVMTLEITPENRLQITFKSSTTRTFTLPIIDIEEKEQRIPELSFPMTIETASHVLNDAIEDVDIVGESVSFEVHKEGFVVSAEGDLSKAMIEVKNDDVTKIKIDTNEKIRAKYSIEYLKKMMMGSKLADTVKIMFNKDYPLKLEYKTVDKVLLDFILAPRVDNE